MIRKLLLFALTGLSVLAQIIPNIEGEVVDSGGHPISNVTVTLCMNSICTEQTSVNAGRFRFQIGAARGNYSIQVSSASGEILVSHPIYVDMNQPPVRVTVPDSVVATAATGSGAVSIRRLSHHPPKAAAKELDRALESFRRQEPQAGAEHLAKALAVNPEFPDAHYLLGLTLEANGFGDEALKHLEDAAPAFPKAHVFAAKILSKAGHLKEAQSHLRKYLQTGDSVYRDQVLAFLGPGK